MDERNEMESAPSVPKKTGGSAMKIVIVGIPLFIIQLVAVYFITANILLNRMQQETNTSHPSTTETAHGEKGEEGAKKEGTAAEFGKFIHSIEDIIVNPAGTDGKKIFLMSVSFDLGTEAEKTLFKEKEILLKDAIISTVSAKNLRQLNDVAYRDTLKSEIVKQAGEIIPTAKVNKVYFSKFIIN